MATLKVLQDKNILTVSLPESLGKGFPELMATESKAWLMLGADIFIFDFAQVKDLPSSSYRPFVVFSRLVKQAQKSVASLNLSKIIDQQIRRDGVSSSLNPFVSESDVRQKCAPPQQTKGDNGMDVSIINPVIEAVVSTLSGHGQTTCNPGRPYLHKTGEKHAGTSVSIVGMINIVCSKVDGSIALAFSEEVFLKIYENMFGEKHAAITPELEDAAAEILNIIYGTTKTVVNKTTDYEFQPAIPTVFAGQKIRINQQTNEKVIILPFESSAGAFHLEIALQRK